MNNLLGFLIGCLFFYIPYRIGLAIGRWDAKASQATWQALCEECKHPARTRPKRSIQRSVLRVSDVRRIIAVAVRVADLAVRPVDDDLGPLVDCVLASGFDRRSLSRVK